MVATEDTLIGSSGSLVAAGFETAGYYLQSRSLDALSHGYGLALANFLFLLAIIISAVIYALGGQYKFFRWLIVCPGLFFFVMYHRVESSGVKWKFGSSDHGAESVQRMGEGEIDSSSLPKVSWIFARWNQFSSNIVQGFVSAIMVFKNRNEREIENLLTKATKFRAILTLEVEDPDIAKFLSKDFLEPCAPYLNLHQQMLPNNAMMDFEDIRGRIEQLNSRPVLSSTDTDYKLLQRLIDRSFVNEADETYFPQADERGVRQFRCSELWLISVKVLKRWGEQASTSIANTQLSALIAKFKQGGISDEEAKNAMLNTVAVSTLLRLTQQIIPQMTNEAAKATRLQDLVQLDQKKALGDRVHEIQDTSADMKILNNGYEYQGKGQFLTMMLSLPYMQGFLLYFLSWMFPWFCFVLLIPGRHLSFLHWFGLWFWVKSWDVGIAIVLVIEDLLFYLMPSGSAITDENVTNVTAALKLALSADPSYSVQLYYTIIAGLLASVPVLCGFLIKRGSGDAMNALNQGFGQFSKQVGASMASVMRSLGMNRLTKEIGNRASQAYQDAFEQKSEAVMKQLEDLSNPAALAKWMQGAMQGSGASWLKSAVNQGHTVGQVQGMVMDYVYKNGMADAHAAGIRARWSVMNSEEVVNLQARTRMYKAYPQEFLQKDIYAAWNEQMRARRGIQWAEPYQNMFSNALSANADANVVAAKKAEEEQQASKQQFGRRGTRIR